MARRQEDQAVTTKLQGIRERLMGEPSRDELEAMQLHLDVLARWDQVSMMMMASHDHDHMDDHDHTA